MVWSDRDEGQIWTGEGEERKAIGKGLWHLGLKGSDVGYREYP
jgi:hypothetical protein